MKYELWIDDIWQDTFQTPMAAGLAITAWLLRHEAYGNVNLQIRIIK